MTGLTKVGGLQGGGGGYCNSQKGANALCACACQAFCTLQNVCLCFADGVRCFMSVMRRLVLCWRPICMGLRTALDATWVQCSQQQPMAFRMPNALFSSSRRVLEADAADMKRIPKNRYGQCQGMPMNGLCGTFNLG